MANPLELKLTRYLNGDALVDTLNGAEVTLKHTYNPKPGDGESDISETVALVFEGAQATVQSTINTINRYLADARARNANGYGDRVYLEARAGTAAAWRRTEILAGRLNVTDDGLQAGLTSNDRTNANLSITRRGWWENTAGTYLPVYNSNGTADAGGTVNVFNCADGTGVAPNKRENYVYAGAASILGDMAAPVTVYANYAGTAKISSIYAAHAEQLGGTAEFAGYHYRDISGSADATCSGGAYVSASITAGTATFITGVVITSPAALSLGGAPYHVIARFRDASSLANVRFQLRFHNNVDTWFGPLVALSTNDLIQDLGIVNLPPGLASDNGSGTLDLWGTRTTTNTETINIDFWQYFGTEFVRLKTILAGDGLYKYGGANKIVSHLGKAKTAYAMDTVGYGADTFTVVPNKSNLYFFLIQLSNGTAPITDGLGIYMTYRPRWSSPL